jgi:hypothetical protein
LCIVAARQEVWLRGDRNLERRQWYFGRHQCPL